MPKNACDSYGKSNSTSTGFSLAFFWTFAKTSDNQLPNHAQIPVDID
jgi:hypothetical protein